MVTIKKGLYQVVAYIRHGMMWVAYALIFFAVLSTIFRSLTPFASQFKPQLEQILADMIKAPVAIQNLETGWYWFQPMLRAKQVHIGNNSYKGVHINELDLGLDLIGSVWHRRLQPGLLLVDGVSIALHQGKSGWVMDDLPLDPNHNEQLALNELISIILNHKSIQLKNINLRMHFDPVIQQNLMIITHCQHSITKDTSLMRIGLVSSENKSLLELISQSLSYYQESTKACPSYMHWPIDYAFESINLTLVSNFGSYKLTGDAQLLDPKTKLHLGAEFIVDPNHVEELSGHLYLQWGKIELPLILNAYLAKWAELKHADVGGEVWINLNLGLLNSIYTKFDLSKIIWINTSSQKPGKLNQISGNLQWSRTKDGYEVVADHFIVQDEDEVWEPNSWMFKINDMHTFYELAIEHFDLTRWLNLPVSWPLSIQPYQAMNLTGILKNIHIIIESGQWKFLTAFDNLGWRKYKNWPETKNLKGVLSLQPNDGHIALDSENLLLNVPNYRALSFPLVNLDLAWNLHNDDLSVHVNTLKILHPNIKLNGNGRVFKSHDATKSTMDIDVNYEVHDGEFWLPFLPKRVLKPKLYDWLRYDIHHIDTALGQITAKGNLQDFPYDNGSGKFKIDTYLKGVDLNYAPHWPGATNINGRLKLDSRYLTVNIDQAKIQQASIDSLSISVADLGLDKERLLVHGMVKQAYAQQAWDIVLNSPLGEKNPIFSDMSWQGRASLDLILDVPLYPQDDEVLVKGVVGLKQAKLYLEHPYIMLKSDHLQGDLHFDQLGLTDSKFQANIWHHETPISVVRNTKTTNDTKLIVKAKLSSDELLKTLKQSPNKHLSGSLIINTELRFPLDKKQPQSLTVTSNLHGLGLRLNPYYLKSKKVLAPMKIELLFPGNKKFKLNSSFDLPSLDDNSSMFKPKFNLLRDDDGLWQANIKLPLIQGLIKYDSVKNKINADLQEFIWKNNVDKPSKEITNYTWTPQDIPSLDLDVQAFYYNDLPLGHLLLHGDKKSKENWTIDSWSLQSKDYEFSGAAAWQQTKRKNQSSINIDAKSADIKQLLLAWKYPAVLEKGKMNLHADLEFPVAPWQIKLANMSGALKGKISNGRTMVLSHKTENKLGIIKILSILSLQSIPRRLQLDFSDLSHDGYSFDDFDGEFKIQQGVMQIERCTLDGPVITTEIMGRVDLVEKVYDLTARIAPQLTSSLPVVATIAGGPVLGAATWLVNRVVNKGMQTIASYTYRITGPWSEPIVEPLKFQRHSHR